MHLNLKDLLLSLFCFRFNCDSSFFHQRLAKGFCIVVGISLSRTSDRILVKETTLSSNSSADLIRVAGRRAFNCSSSFSQMTSQSASRKLRPGCFEDRG